MRKDEFLIIALQYVKFCHVESVISMSDIFLTWIKEPVVHYCAGSHVRLDWKESLIAPQRSHPRGVTILVYSATGTKWCVASLCWLQR